ncbi:TetR/AcrR family transcriptional regulator [Conexibacter stalactiti]|uniref:TetR/AcrR family transcriptional regulator n=1 Tax=Conexibacter stalactiti TaxID=1940611 RepID=A0ABU4HWB1_9ACTN|nr:TetR/AcrR family transcriptional regulator [Conexibacter stalactiti]MDW5597618.1 TetR/AcrR family transcriptional regulator [Conexibacter stalactiti]MEC5038260.1 TetR/AcrR family transcriptional regulator [Conexibacter stalactiti]
MASRTGPQASTPTAVSVALRERVLDEAAELFARKSYAGTTTEEIADAVGELRGTVYYHFENKQAILEAIQRRMTEELVRRLTEARNAGGTAAERVERMLAAFVDYALSRPSDFATSLEDLKYLEPKARRKAERRSDAVRLLLAEAIEDALAEAPRRNVDSGIAAVSILYALATMYRWYRPRGRLSRDEVIGQVTGLLLRGLIDR